VSELTDNSEAELLALMRADRLVQSKRHAEQVAVDLEAVGLRPRRRHPDPTPDKINEAFKLRLGAKMENTHADGTDFAMLDWDDGLQRNRGVSRSNRDAFHVPDIRLGRGSQAPGACGQVRQGGVRPQERTPNYPVVAAWVSFLIFIGAGAFALGMAVHNEAIAQQHTPLPEPIYYCSTGVEMPLFEPCKEMKDRKNI
jgi:hypothetical protein